MTDQDKKIHDLKFELRQQCKRIDILEQNLINLNKAFRDNLASQLIEVQLVNKIIQDIAEMKGEKE